MKQSMTRQSMRRQSIPQAPSWRSGHVWLFLLLVCLFALAADTLRLRLDHPNTMLDRFAMWGPAFATAITCWRCRIDIRALGWGWPRARWLVLAGLAPLLYAAPVYLATWIAVPQAFAPGPFMASIAGSYGLAPWPLAATLTVGLPLLLTVGLISGLTWALGEETGWRGFLFPRLLARFGFNRACLLGGLIWAAWHYPALIWGHYNAGTHPVFALACFTCSATALSFVLGWLRLRSASIWPCALLHASHNLLVQAIFDPLTADTGLARYLSTEFGIGLAFAIALLALILGRSFRARAPQDRPSHV